MGSEGSVFGLIRVFCWVLQANV